MTADAVNEDRPEPRDCECENSDDRVTADRMCARCAGKECMHSDAHLIGTDTDGGEIYQCQECLETWNAGA